MAALEARRAVVAAADFNEVFAFVVVVQTAEETHQGVFVLAAADLHALVAVGALSHQIEVHQRFGEQVVARGRHVLEILGLPVESGHRLEVVLLVPRVCVGGVDVGLIVVVHHGLFVELVLEAAARREGLHFARILRVFGVDLTVEVVLGVEHVGEVTLDLQPFDRGPRQLRGGRHVVGLVLVVVAALVHDRGQAVHDRVFRQRGVVDARAVGVVGHHRSQSVYRAQREGGIDSAGAGVVVLVVVVAGVVADLEPLVDVERDFRTEVDPLQTVGVLTEESLFAVVVARKHVLDLRVAARQRDAVARVGVFVLEQVVVPVEVGVVNICVAAVALVDLHPRTFGVFDLVVAAGPQFHHVLLGVVGVVGACVGVPEQVVDVDRVVAAGFVVGRGGGGVPAPAAAVRYAGFSRIVALLGGHQHDAVGRACAVDGGCRGILDHRNRGHVVGVELHQVALGAVDQHERRTAVDRGDAADVQVGRVARTARCGRDRQTRNRTLKHVGYGGRRAACELRVVHRGDGSRQVDLLLGAVTYDYDVLHLHGVLGEEYLEVVLRGGDGDFLGDVAQVGEAEHRIGIGNGDGETAVVLGHGAARIVALQRDGDAGQGKLVGVVDRAGDRARSGRGLARRGDQGDLAFGDREIETRRGEHLAQGGGDRQLFGAEADAPGQVGLLGVVEECVFAALLDARNGFRERYVGELKVDRRLLRLAVCNRCPSADEQQKNCE